MIAPSDLAVVVLAGGEGRRIGGGKPLRVVAGRTLIARALSQARHWSRHVAVAAGAAGRTLAADAPLLDDDPAVEGPLAGLAAALRHAKREKRPALLTIPCDSPFLPDDLPDRLIAMMGGRAAAIAASAGRVHPVCALWKVEVLAGLPAYLATGRRSLHGFAEHVGHAVADWPADPLDPFFNVNTVEDLVRAEEWLGSMAAGSRSRPGPPSPPGRERR